MEGREIRSLTFQEPNIVEIQYLEEYDISERAAIIRTLVFEAGLVEEPLKELISDIHDLIDVAIDRLRNPPSLHGRSGPIAEGK